MPDVVRLEALTKRYGRHRGVEELNLEIPRGEIFGYLGPNGAGKTTTIRLLLDLLRPTAGSIKVLGESPRHHHSRRRIGYLPGELDFYPQMRGHDLIRYLDNLRGGDSIAHARRLAERLELDMSREVGQLSKGNRQKLGLVQAFMHHPELLILDEPTSGLDPLMQRQFFLLVEEAHSDGATVFLSSHVLAEVERIAHRVGIIREGRLVEVATIDDLRARALRRYQLRLSVPVAPSRFDDIEGVSQVEIDGSTVSCVVTGSMAPLVKAAAELEVLDIINYGANLEKLFLSYYAGDDA
ncbi:ABC transporter ATP-binding protein [soil metagenome]